MSSLRPWMKFYPSDWRADPKLRMCGLAARGLWMDMLALMHEAEPYGYLVINGMAPDARQLGSIIGAPGNEVGRLLRELDSAGVFSRNDAGLIYSRRMVRDKAKLEQDREYGKRGGNPHVKQGQNGGDNGGVNPTGNGGDKAHKPEARVQKEKNGTAPVGATPDLTDPKTQFYARAKQLLGERHGGALATKLLEAKGGSVAQARAALEQASERADPREYIGAIIAKGHEPPAGETQSRWAI